MYCMKCGREVDTEQVFCSECLLDMEKYPVPPGTTVQLPRRREAQPVKKTGFRRKSLSSEEQIKQLRLRLRILMVMLVLVTILAALLIRPAVTHLMEDHYERGQNYSSYSRAESTPY